MEHSDPAGLIYTFHLRAEDGDPLAEGRATISLSRGPRQR